MKRAVIFSALGANSISDDLQKKLSETFDATYIKNEKPLPPNKFIELVNSFHFIALTRRALVCLDDNILSKLPLLEGVSAYSTGKEWIDEKAFTKRGIRLETLPIYCTNAVAEVALGLILMQQHKLHLRYLKTTKKIPNFVSLRGSELAQKNVGIIGYGKIGSCIALKMKYLCKNIFVNDTDFSKINQLQDNVISASKIEIIEHCDIIIVCASQQFEEQYIWENTDYQSLKKNAVILNIARKSLLNHQLLLNLVKKKQIEAYIFDDLMQETDVPDEVEFGKIIPTGHTAWYTDNAIKNGTFSWINNLINFSNK